MKSTLLLVFLSILVVICRAGQYEFSDFYTFSGGLDANYRSARDPRQNTGPVVFPPAPPDNGETSGVIVGASGYGFVPPNRVKFHSPFWPLF